MPPSSNNRGFTLLELLIALALLGILAGALYGTYFSLIKGREAASEGMEERRELRSTLDLMRREISAALYKQGNSKHHFSIEDRDIYGKPASILAFTAVAPPQPGGLAVSDQQDLRYEIVERDKKMLLGRSARDLYQSTEAARYPQMEDIEGFLVECRSGDKWVRSWDSAINLGLPREVRITITVKEGDKSVPYSVVATPRIAL
ncbi:MAG: prepilin-type N-terminal cleavage/methylation domain-containing protein [Geobacter sp.]|nr:prepilin-type N-terminal cleavage/methylation domain-containing protein [Geobacter sp.]